MSIVELHASAGGWTTYTADYSRHKQAPPKMPNPHFRMSHTHSESWNSRLHQVGPARTSTSPHYILVAYMASGHGPGIVK